MSKESIERQAEPRGETQPRAGDTYTIKGGQSVVWGVADTSTLGTVTNVSVSKSAEHELLYSQQGAVNGVVIFDEKTEVKMTVIASATATMPGTGSALTVATVAGIVLSTTESKEYKGLVKFEVTVSKWTNLVIS